MGAHRLGCGPVGWDTRCQAGRKGRDRPQAGVRGQHRRRHGVAGGPGDDEGESKRYKVGPRPYGIAVSKDGKTVAVGVEDEECVKFFSLPDFKEKGRTKIGKMFNDHIVLTQDGKHVLVANFYSDDVVGIDVETMKEAFRIKDCSAPHVVKYGPLGKHAYVTCKKITGDRHHRPGRAQAGQVPSS